MKNLILLGVFIIIPTAVLATVGTFKTEPEPKWKESFRAKKERIDEICEQLIEEGSPKPIVRGPHVKLGKAVEWVATNINKPDGWSLTGFAKLKIHKDGNMSRWKFGIINGEQDWSLYQELDKSRHHRSGFELLEDWNRRKNEGVTFGIYFTRTFGK